MSDTNPNPPPENTPAPADAEKALKALHSEREERKADRLKHTAFRAAAAKALGLAEDAAPDAILSRLGEADTSKAVADATTTLTRERDEARTKLADVESKWTGDRIDRALSEAFAASGAISENREDFLSLARPLFTVDAKTGAVVTKADAPNTVPGMEAAAFVHHGGLKQLRPHWWPSSVGGGARGGSKLPNSLPGDPSCFKSGNVTAIARYIDTHGAATALRACRSLGVNPPAFLLKAGAP